MAPTVTIAGRKIGPEYAPYIVAEMSGNHCFRALGLEGAKKRAKMIFEQAKIAGVDAIKIQTYLPKSLSIEIAAEKISSKPQWKEAWGWGTGDIYNLYKQVYTPQGEFTDYLFGLGKEFGLTVFSTPFGVEDAKLLAIRYNPPAYKLGALEMDFFPMLEVIAQTGKPIILNTAVFTTEKINKTLEFLKKANSGPVILLTGPKVYHEDSAKNFGLGRLDALNEIFGKDYVIGLSDHFRGGNYNKINYLGHEFSTAGILQYNASLVEKHFCGIHSGMPGQAFVPDTGIMKVLRKLTAKLGIKLKKEVDWSKSDLDGGASVTTEEMKSVVAWAKLAFKARQQKLTPEETSLLEIVKRMAAYGYGEKKIGPSKAEIDTNEAGATRFIYAVRDLPQGHTLTLEDLHFCRAIHHANPNWKKNTPLPTSTVAQVLGVKTLKAVEKGDPIFAEMLSKPVDLKKAYEPGLFTLNVPAMVG